MLSVGIYAYPFCIQSHPSTSKVRKPLCQERGHQATCPTWPVHGAGVEGHSNQSLSRTVLGQFDPLAWKAGQLGANHVFDDQIALVAVSAVSIPLRVEGSPLPLRVEGSPLCNGRALGHSARGGLPMGHSERAWRTRHPVGPGNSPPGSTGLRGLCASDGRFTRRSEASCQSPACIQPEARPPSYSNCPAETAPLLTCSRKAGLRASHTLGNLLEMETLLFLISCQRQRADVHIFLLNADSVSLIVLSWKSPHNDGLK